MPADRRATRDNLASGAVVALVGAVYMGYAVRTGLPFGAAVRALAAAAVFQVLPGVLLWRLVRPRRGWLIEDLAMGFALGIALAVPTQVVAGLTQQRWVAFALPLLVTAVLVGIPRARRRIVAAEWVPIAWWLTPLVSIVSFWALRQLVTYFRVNQITWQGPGRPHIDAYLHQALASQLLHRGPTSWPTVMGEDMGYHWFTHAWLAHVTATSGAGLDLVLLRVMPALMPLAVVVCVMVAALRLSGSPKVALLASVLAMVGSYGNPFGIASIGLPLTPDSPTLALGVPTLLALVLLLDQRWSGNLSRGGYVLIPVLSVIAAGTKGATSPLVVAGLGLALVGMLVWNRRLWLPVLVDLVVVAAGLLFAVVFVFRGSSAGLALGITDAAKQTYVFTTLGALPDPWLTRATAVLVVLGGLTRAALSFAPLFGRVQRRHPLPWLLAGGSLAGAGAVGVFSHPGQSQGYFLSTAIPLAAIGSALGARALARALGPEKVRTLLPLAVAGGALIHIAPTRLGGALTKGAYASFTKALVVAVVLVVILAVAGWMLGGPAHRWRSSLATVAVAGVCVGVFTGLNSVRAPLFPEANRPASTSDFQSISQDQLDAARWIRDHSDVDDVVMTNRHCTTVREPRGGCDSRRWVVTAFSERQSLVEGWTATPRATEIAPEGRTSVTVDYWRPDILELNDGFIAAPTEAARTRLWNLGVRWVYVDTLQAHADTLAPYAELGFDSPDATAWKLLPPG
jgi:hypothetical protein